MTPARAPAGLPDPATRTNGARRRDLVEAGAEITTADLTAPAHDHSGA